MVAFSGDYKRISEAAIRFVEEYSDEALRILSEKEIISTQSSGLNRVLNGGIATQEVTEILGENHMHNGELIIHILVHQLYVDKNAEAVMITSNGVQNDDTIYRVAHRHVATRLSSDDVDEMAFDIMKRIFIVQCLDIRELMAALEDVSNGKYKKAEQADESHQYMGYVSSGNASAPYIDGLCQDRDTFHPGTQPSANRWVSPGRRAFRASGKNSATLKTIAIHILTSILEDSQQRDAWKFLPSLCRKIRSTARQMNVGIIVSNIQDEGTMGPNNPDDVPRQTTKPRDFTPEDEEPDRQKAKRGWYMSSARWNSTVDKRIEVMVHKYDRDSARSRFAVHLTRSRLCATGASCELELSQHGMRSQIINAKCCRRYQ
ncbi:DNA repair RAD51 homolog 3-like protein, putative [Babesia ovata]|uniref:DNA repair RAD51 homolog 3-like protein, putative n=1 Tax=Babesia ovata TaxID=189622 RepID=A0A2H6KF62_9APIC|nr:DNA repair RAD51 homolog 3-like protein, putative [Babesia ovata]GBE61599.1 DNA repair RAD51 homolog 3-like protein, putative [Babesia ovata]